MAFGRPLKFQSVQELQNGIDDYFSATPKEEWTWTGLALFLDTDKETLKDYRENRADFIAPLKNAMLKVENGYEIDLKKSGRTGTIFALKNFDWKDKTESDQNLNVKGNLTIERTLYGENKVAPQLPAEDISTSPPPSN